jgi:vitamin B12 transporter
VSVKLIILAAAFLVSGSAAAQFLDPELADDAELETLIVTASRVPTPRALVGSSVSVIERATLDVQQQRFVADALRDVPGVAVSRAGGLGGVAQVRMRGAEGNHTLVLIDGIEANNPIAGSEFDFANLRVADIERIEILRGPQSALYGSDAVGGVINVITRRPDTGLDAQLRAEGGSLGSRELGVSIGGGGERLSGAAALSSFRTDGENASRFGSEIDGFENDDLSVKGEAILTEAMRVNALVRRIESRQEFDTQDFAFPATATQGLLVDDDTVGDMTQTFGRIELNRRAPRVAHRLGVSSTRTGYDVFDDLRLASQNSGERLKLDYQANIALGESSAQDLTIAFERELLEYENRGADRFSPENQTQTDEQTSIVAEYRKDWSAASLSASARLDSNELFQDASTYRLTGSLTIGNGRRLHTSLGTGVANPGFFELFGFFPGSFVGNPDLRPERSTSFDVGLEQRFAAVTVDLTYFRADLSDEIETVFDASTLLSTVINLEGESSRRGYELSVVAEPAERWQLRGAYTYTDAEQPDGRHELRRPRHIASLDTTVVMAGGRARVHGGIDYSGAQHDAEFIFATPEDRVRLSGFMLMRIGADYAFSERLRLYGRIENALDEQYEELFSYRGRGRTALLGFEARLAD